jgi:hypothetical protein
MTVRGELILTGMTAATALERRYRWLLAAYAVNSGTSTKRR